MKDCGYDSSSRQRENVAFSDPSVVNEKCKMVEKKEKSRQAAFQILNCKFQKANLEE